MTTIVDTPLFKGNHCEVLRRGDRIVKRAFSPYGRQSLLAERHMLEKLWTLGCGAFLVRVHSLVEDELVVSDAGLDLFEWCARDDVGPRRASITRQMLHAVHVLHDRGIVHLDLKLENMCVDAAGTLRLIDFETAIASDGRGLRRLCGSRSYSCPEIMNGLAYDGMKADAWSVGYCVFALWTGKFPFENASLSTPTFARFVHHMVRTKLPSRAIAEMWKRPIPSEIHAVLDACLMPVAEHRCRLLGEDVPSFGA